MPNALLSIITPVLNGARFLPDAIESVAQAARLGVPIEQVIVDGGSRDASVEIARYAMSLPGSPITHVLTGPDSGQANAINRGVAISSGTFVGWLNADDVIVPEGIAKLVMIMSETHADVVLGRCRFVDLAGRTVFAPIPPDPVTPESLLRLLSGWFAGRSIVQPEAFVRREALVRFGSVEESLHYTMDHHLWVRLAAARVVFHSEPIEVARQLVHPGQKTADNIAVAKEMLTYAESTLAEQPETQESERAHQEIMTVSARIKRAESIASILDRIVRADPGVPSVVTFGPCLPIPQGLLREWASASRTHNSILLAGLDQKNRGQFTECCQSIKPPVIVGRLPEVSAQFDLVLTSRSGLEGLSRGFDATRLLKPGGTLCILGAVPGQQFRAELRSIRRMTADRVTFNARTFLDVPIPSELKECLRELESQSREIAIPSASSVKFLPKPSTGSSETDRLEGERVFQTLAALFGVTVIQI